jgi:hypothetical protein
MGCLPEDMGFQRGNAFAIKLWVGYRSAAFIEIEEVEDGVCLARLEMRIDS